MIGFHVLILDFLSRGIIIFPYLPMVFLMPRYLFNGMFLLLPCITGIPRCALTANSRSERYATDRQTDRH